MNDEQPERSRRDSDHKMNTPQSVKPGFRASKTRLADTSGLKSSSAMRAPANYTFRTKATKPSAPVPKPISVNGSSLHSAPSNPPRNPPTTHSLDQDVRSNGGRSRPQGSVETVRSSNTQPASTSTAKKTSSKKIV